MGWIIIDGERVHTSRLPDLNTDKLIIAPIMIDKDKLEELGLLIDKADNYLALQGAPLPTEIQIDSLKTGLKEVREEILKIYLSLGGTNEWENR